MTASPSEAPTTAASQTGHRLSPLAIHTPGASSAISAFFQFVERKDAAFRMVFESDLINEPVVAARVERMSTACATSVAEVISEDTGLPDDQALMLGVALVGMAQVVARFWIAQEPRMPRHEAERLVTVLGWRGIAGFPKSGDQS